jgi:hypothetical protein
MSVFFEKQQDRDCVVHSLNNAVGRVVVTKAQVLKRIDKLTAEFGAAHSPEETKRYSDSLAVGGTFFSADVVWDTAKSLGTIGEVVVMPGFGGDFADLDTLPSWVRSSSLAVLGLDMKGRPHAIAARGGVLYDSQRWREGPRPLNNSELSKMLSRVVSLFVVRTPSDSRLHIVRTQPITMHRRRVT